jgi:hypothetical protein
MDSWEQARTSSLILTLSSFRRGQVKDMDEMDMIGYARWIQMVGINWLVVWNIFHFP